MKSLPPAKARQPLSCSSSPVEQLALLYGHIRISGEFVKCRLQPYSCSQLLNWGSAEKARSLYLHQAVPGDFGLETTALGHTKASASPLASPRRRAQEAMLGRFM